jgi:hypothetical protein
MNDLDTHATIETTELRDLARVIKRALGLVIAFWAQTLPPTHPYRQAARMIESYLGERYGV